MVKPVYYPIDLRNKDKMLHESRLVILVCIFHESSYLTTIAHLLMILSFLSNLILRPFLRFLRVKVVKLTLVSSCCDYSFQLLR